MRFQLPGRWWNTKTAFVSGVIACQLVHLVGGVLSMVRITIERPGDEPVMYRYEPAPVHAPAPVSTDEGLSAADEAALASLDVVEVERPAEPVRRRAAAKPRPVVPSKPVMTAAEQALDVYRVGYIDQYGSVARAAATDRVPASYLLALALVNGGSDYALKANNHFDVRCTSKTCPEGHCLRSDQPDQHKWFFTRYRSAAESYAAKAQSLDFVNFQDPAIARVVELYNLRRFDR